MLLPNLDRLTLDTGGRFALVTAADRARFANDGTVDVATLAPPGEEMMFQLESEALNDDGSPHIVYLNGSTLWTWIRAHQGQLPNGLGFGTNQRILYEDYWRLWHAFGQGDGQPARPAWVNGLERENAFAARMANARAEKAAQHHVTQETALSLNAGRSPMPNETWVRWCFWVRRPQPAEAGPVVATFIMAAFMDLWRNMHYTNGRFRTAISSSHSRHELLQDEDMLINATDVSNPQNTRLLWQIAFAVRMRRSWLGPFMEVVNTIIERYGYADFLRRAHGLDHAFGGAVDGCPNNEPHEVSPVLQADGSAELPPVARGCPLPVMTNAQYLTLVPYTKMAHRATVSALHWPQTPNPADTSTRFPPPRIVPIRWRFYLKGTVDGPNGPGARQLEKHMKRTFFLYMRDKTTLDTGPNGQRKWNNQLALRFENRNIAVKDDDERPDPAAQQARLAQGQPAIICTFLLELPEPHALAFMDYCRQNGRDSIQQAFLFQDMFGVIQARVATPASDMPRENRHSTFGPSLGMTPDNYDQWAPVAYVRNGSDGAGPSGSA